MKDREAPRSTPVREPSNPSTQTGSEPQTNTDLPTGNPASETEADRLRRQSK